ncbi:MAG: hypothetical protein Q8R39_00250 [bacterium]|nr:hypothetical protein [bacterium]MDZ4284300.1 hypothetical protein [Patescibacteria group bacterium]
MHRTQIQLDERLFEAIREQSFREGSSVAGTVRRALRASFSLGDYGARTKFSFIASGRSRGKGSGTIARLHDDAFADSLTNF